MLRSQVVCEANLPDLQFQNRGSSTSRGVLRTSIKKGGHTKESNFPEICIGDRLRHHLSEYRRCFARVSGNVGTTKACTPDVRRLCSAQIPDADRIVACLLRNTPQLSDRCRAVFAQRDAPSRGDNREYGLRRYDRDYGLRRSDRDYGTRPYEDRDYGPRSYPRPYDYDEE